MNKKEKGLLSTFAVIMIIIVAAVVAVSMADGKSKENFTKPSTQLSTEDNVIVGDISVGDISIGGATVGDTSHQSNTESTTNQTKITVDDAKNTALKDAGFDNAGAVVLTAEKLDYDDGRQVYEIDFHDGKTEYEYEIDPSTGEIVSRSSEPFDFD